MAELASTVHVHGERGVVSVFGPGDAVPAWAQKLITNPKAWAVAPVAEKSAPVVQDVAIPPKGGPKATVSAWTEYARAQGFAIDVDASRKEIIAALDAEGIPTE